MTTYRMAIAYKNQNGESDIEFVKVSCTDAELGEQKDESAAIGWVLDNYCVESNTAVAFNCDVFPKYAHLALMVANWDSIKTITTEN